MNSLGSIITVFGILFRFLGSGFYWILNREIKFDPPERHFKLVYWLFFLSLALTAFFGIIIPLYHIVQSNSVPDVFC